MAHFAVAALRIRIVAIRSRQFVKELELSGLALRVFAADGILSAVAAT